MKYKKSVNGKRFYTTFTAQTERQNGTEGDYVREVASAGGGWKCSE
jgi:hypothetical protein